jgi:hypothetical protein
VTDETNGALDDESRSPERPGADKPGTDDVLSPPEDEVEGATPPGYDWPTHGGYLGCLMGVMAGVLFGGFIGANIFAAYYNVLNLPLAVYILLNVALFLALLIGLGRLGWWLGRRFYRYYPQPAGATWGEANETEAVSDATKLDQERQEASHASSASDALGPDTAPSVPEEQRPA